MSEATPEATTDRPGRNDPCHCGSGNKYKRCCLAKDQAAAREVLPEADAEATTPAADANAAPDAVKPKRPTEQPWKRGAGKSRPFQRFQTPRKSGGG